MIYITVKLGLAPALTTRIDMRVVRAEGYLYIEQCFSTFVRPRPGKLYFRKTRPRSQKIYS